MSAKRVKRQIKLSRVSYQNVWLEKLFLSAVFCIADKAVFVKARRKDGRQ